MHAVTRTPLAVACVAALGGCLDDDGSRTFDECFSIQDCAVGEICFLGSCVDPGYSITTVYAELSPPNNTPWLHQQHPVPLDLSDGMQRISLRAGVALTGVVGSNSSSLTGMLRAQSAGSIPGREVVRQATVSSSGYSLQVVPDTYALTFTPDTSVPGFDAGCGEVPALPPVQHEGVPILTDGGWDFPYPAADDLVLVCGRLRWTTSTGTWVGGARVHGASQYSGSLLRSAEALTLANGEFALAFPPGASVFDIAVGPGTNPDVPHTTFPGVTTTTPPNWIDDVVLNVVGQPEPVSAVVRDDSMKVVADASVIFDGQVGQRQSRFTVVGTTDELGNVGCDQALCSLLPGTYTVTVVPLEAQPYAITSTQVEVPTGQIALTVRNKVVISGFISSHDAQPVSGATVTLSQRGSLTRRQFTAVANADGWYRAEVDPGEVGAPAEYEVAIEPDKASGLPWYHELLRVEADDEVHNVELYRPSFAYGQVLDPIGGPLADVIIAFYSLELGIRNGEPLLVGVVQSSKTGEFVLPVPTPNSP